MENCYFKFIVIISVLLYCSLFGKQNGLEVISVFPSQNNNNVTSVTPIQIDFNLPIDTTNIIDQFVILGNMNGLYPFTIQIDPLLETIYLNPINNFLIGEKITAIARQSIVGFNGENFSGFVWQFNIKPTKVTPPYFSELKIFTEFYGWYYTTMFPADVNNDNNIDIVILSSPIQIAINDGMGNFSLGQQLSNFPENPDIALTDLDLDGFKEIVCTGGIYEADINGNFQFKQGFNNWVFDAADMNRDGYPDLIMRDYVGENGVIIGISYNDGTGHFAEMDTILVDSIIVDAIVGDFNNDGINDIAYATEAFPTPGGIQGHHSLRIVYLGSNGDILFRDIYNSEDFPYQALFFPNQVSILDLNNDNYLDLFIGSMDNFIVLNNPQNGFLIDSALIVGGGGEGYSVSTFKDITADGWIDHIYTGQFFTLDGGVCRYNINMGGHFPTVWGDDLEERYNVLPFIATAGDFNGNGSQDVATLWNDGLRVHINDDQVSIPLSQQNIPQQFILYQNYPNPFNGETYIKFYLPTYSELESVIYDINGREVKRYYTKKYLKGRNILKWDSKDKYGKEVSSGVYIWKLKTQEVEKSIKITLIR